MNYLLLVMLLVACGQEDQKHQECVTDGCAQTDNRRTAQPSPGSAGRDGVDGRDGAPGAAGLPGSDGADGAAGKNGKDGTDGSAGRNGIDGVNGRDGSACSVSRAIGGSLITCTDGTSVVLLDGVAGPAGAQGSDGVMGPTGPAGATGPQGSPGQDGTNGTDGTAGPVGPVGPVGATGATGPAGHDGLDAPPTPYTITEVIDPCGDQTQFDEVLLRLANGQLVAHFANGSLQFLSVIGPGNYVTTDGTHCYFSVDSNLQIYGEHN